MSNPAEKERINQLITRIFDTHISSITFKKTLLCFLNAYSRPATWSGRHYTHTPTALFIQHVLNTLIDQRVSPRQQQTNRGIANAAATHELLTSLYPRTRENLIAALGGRDRYENIVDRSVLAVLVELGEKAARKKAVLQHRIWVADEMVSKGFEECAEVGDLVIQTLIKEAQVQCDCHKLFLVEERNRRMVMKWVGG